MSKSATAKPSARPSAAKPHTPQFDEFLNPNAMITPGAAGAFTMVITNTLCSQFDSLAPNYTALAVSFLFGAIVFRYGSVLAARVLYFIVNSLIIFVVAHGSNTIGARIEERIDKPAKTAALVTPNSNFSIASADGSDKDKPPPAGQDQQQKSKFFRRW